MSFDPSSGYAAASNLQDITQPALPIFNIERVEFKFSIASDFVAAQVANNVLILALSSGRILRIDLDSPADIDDIDLPKKASEIGTIKSLFLDPSASHLIITTTLNENFYLHTQSRQPKSLSRLKGVPIESIAWNPSQPTASTREILIGASDGNVYEVYIEPSTEFYQKKEKYLKNVYKADGAVVGLWTDTLKAGQETRRVLLVTPTKLMHWMGKTARQGSEGSGSIFAKLFESETPTVHTVSGEPMGPSRLAISPESQETSTGVERAFAWLESQGVFHGKLLQNAEIPDLGQKIFSESRTLTKSQLPPPEISIGRARPLQDTTSSIILSQWHIIQLVGDRIVATNRLDDTVVHNQTVLDEGQKAVGIISDLTKNTFWLFTTSEIFEIVANDESRDIWKIMLKEQQFEAATQFAKTAAQRDAVATASGDYLISKGQFMEAATVYGKSSKPFEEVALTFVDANQQDALRKYLMTKLANVKKASIMQRIMVATWLTEIFMATLNALDDTISTDASLSTATTAASADQLGTVKKEFQDFVNRYKSDLDVKTVYEIISSHGREEELLFFATAVGDWSYVLAYWVQRERWQESLNVLKKQTNPEVFYKYSTVLMANCPRDFVDVIMRQGASLELKRLVPALLNYNDVTNVPLNQNQAVRYLQYTITNLADTSPTAHNTLISIYASAPTKDESTLLSYLESQSYAGLQNYDADFALRLCIQHARVQSCVHIYSSMGQYAQAVSLALKYDEVELASIVADRPAGSGADGDAALRKKLWLKVAKKVIERSKGIKEAVGFLKRCELLRIEDLIPFFPDFVLIDDFKDEICAALESYSKSIDQLKHQMDESAATAAHVKSDIKALDQRYAIVEPGERCYICRLPLLARQFYVFPCQHAFHSDCLGKRVVEMAGVGKARRIKELQLEVGKGIAGGARRERAVAELDGLVAAACVLCSDMAVKQIDEPFVLPTDNKDEWAL